MELFLEDDFPEHEDDVAVDALLDLSYEHGEDLRVEAEGDD